MYATFIGVKKLPRCERRVIFCYYYLPDIKTFATGSFFDLLLKTDLHIASTQHAFFPPPQKRATCSMVHFHFYKLDYLKLPILLQTCTQFAVWGNACCATIYLFLCSSLGIKIHSSCKTEIKQTIPSTLKCIFMFLSKQICKSLVRQISPNLFAASVQIFR